MSTGKVTVIATGAAAGVAKATSENFATISIVPTPAATPYTGLSFTIEGSVDGTNYEQVAVLDNKAGGTLVTGGTTISPSDGSSRTYQCPFAQNYTKFRANVSAISAGSVNFLFNGATIQGTPLVNNVAAAAGSFSTITATSLAVTGLLTSSSPTAGIGYATGAGGTVTQITSRTTGVTLNTLSGNVVLFSAAGSATPFSFTLTNSAIAVGDVVIISQKSGTDKYTTQVVTAVAAGSCQITLANATGATVEQPVFNFNVFKGVAA